MHVSNQTIQYISIELRQRLAFLLVSYCLFVLLLLVVVFLVVSDNCRHHHDDDEWYHYDDE